MPHLFFGFLVVTAIWLFFALAWAVALLFWPLTLLVGGLLLWRAKKRSWGQLVPVRVEGARSGPTHNAAFDDYRRETISRLDEEQGRFREFLDGLRRTRDQQDFKEFLATRRDRPALSSSDASTA